MHGTGDDSCETMNANTNANADYREDPTLELQPVRWTEAAVGLH